MPIIFQTTTEERKSIRAALKYDMEDPERVNTMLQILELAHTNAVTRVKRKIK